MKFLIKFPTRGRVDKFFDVLNNYIEYFSDENEYEILVSCDNDDEQMNTSEVRKLLDSYDNLSYYFGPRDSKVGAVNRDMDKAPDDYDILMQPSDDMIPIQESYDVRIVKEMEECFPDGDGVLWFFDGYNKVTDTLTIMGKKYYERFNYLYYPGYTTWFCDTELTEVANLLDRLIFVDEVLFQHEHPDWVHAQGHDGQQRGYDTLNIDNDKKEDRLSDEKIFNERKANNFGLNL